METTSSESEDEFNQVMYHLLQTSEIKKFNQSRSLKLNLTNTDLSNVNLTDANLTNSIISGANLTDVNFDSKYTPNLKNIRIRKMDTPNYEKVLRKDLEMMPDNFRKLVLEHNPNLQEIWKDKDQY